LGRRAYNICCRAGGSLIELFVPSMIGDHDPVGVFETHTL
jgi:hypothetical protein